MKKNEVQKMEEVNPPTSADLKTALDFLGEKEYNADRFAVIAAEEVRQAEIANEIAAIHAVKAGASLLVSKANTEHGDWGAFLNRADIAERTAQKCMLMAQRAADKNMLNSEIFRLGISKAQEVLALPEPEIREIVENDDKLDVFSRMSVRELRGALRNTAKEAEKLKEKVKNGREQLADQEEEIARLKKEKRSPSTLESCFMLVLTELAKAEKKENPEDPEAAADLDVIVREIKIKIDGLYNRFCQTGKIKHKVPENMEELEAEFGG